MIRVNVIARQPLHLGVRPDAGWLTDTHRFVPGSVLRGALAAAWLAENRGPRPDTTADAEFQRLFEGSVRFGPLYPSDDALRPLSVFGCKYPTGEDCAALAHDVAFDGPAPARCRCDSPTVASKGAVHGAAIVGQTRVQLDELERAMDGQLFTRRGLSRGATLTGLIDGDLDGDLGWLAGDRPVRLGGRRSTAGLATLRCMPEPAPPSFSGYRPDRGELVVRLLAPGIFVDALGRPSWLPDTGELAGLLGVEVTIAAAFARPTIVAGWHVASNLPKPRDFAVAAGSVFVLRFGEALPDEDGLNRLWRRGLGLRRAEGNGWVSLQRWSPPARRPASPPAQRSEIDLLARDLILYGVADLVVADLRANAQDRAVHPDMATPAVDDVLSKPRYRDLAPLAREAFVQGLRLSPDETAELAKRLEEWIRTHTSKKGRETP